MRCVCMCVYKVTTVDANHCVIIMHFICIHNIYIYTHINGVKTLWIIDSSVHHYSMHRLYNSCYHVDIYHFFIGT